jgi:hypothetical protein
MSEAKEIQRTPGGIQVEISPITAFDNTTPSGARPILIPTTPASRRDPDRVPTPVSGRGDRKGHLFPVKALSPTRPSHFGFDHEDLPQALSPPRFDHTYHHRSFSRTLSPRPGPLAIMHADRSNTRYTPTSPLSPRLEGANRPISPQPSRAHRRASRPMNIPIPRFHPVHFPQRDMPAPASALSHKPIVNYTRHSSTTESPRLMKEHQRDLINKAKMSSRLAASPHGVKPDAPRLDPLGSPKGPVTPLVLEERSDYFLIPSSGENSPAATPASQIEGSFKEVGESAQVMKATKRGGGYRR